jgi:hypothetical protein
LSLASRELPIGDDERCAAIEVRHETGGLGVFALVRGTVGTQCAEGGGVGAALGGEVATEAEHVCPGGQAQVCEFGPLAEADAFGDVTPGVIADGQVRKPVGWSDAPVEGACAFGGFGGVFGNVGGDLAIGQFPAGRDGPGIEFAAPDQGSGRKSSRSGRCEVDSAGGLVDGCGE